MFPVRYRDLQANNVQFANISFYSKDLVVATYRVDLEKITAEQIHPSGSLVNSPSIKAIDLKPKSLIAKSALSGVLDHTSLTASLIQIYP